MSELREALLVMGFIDVTGWLEGNRRIPILSPNRSLVLGTNNGVWAVVDEFGHTWIISGKAVTRENKEAHNKIFSLPESGTCYVPFSNDGGIAVRQIWPR